MTKCFPLKQGGASNQMLIWVECCSLAMAESSSSGEESSEEEDQSASPSLRGATSLITVANRKTSWEKRALYSERGYLNSLSQQERRRIKREIRKGRKLVVSCPASLLHTEIESGETRIRFWFSTARLVTSNQIAEWCHVIKKRLRCFTVYFALYLATCSSWTARLTFSKRSSKLSHVWIMLVSVMSRRKWYKLHFSRQERVYLFFFSRRPEH